MCEHIPPFLKFNYQLYNYIFNKQNKKKASQNQQTNPPIRPHLRNQSCFNMKPDGLHTHLQSTYLEREPSCVFVCVCVSKTGSLERMVPFWLKIRHIFVQYLCMLFLRKGQSKHVLIRTLLVEGFLEMEDW